MLELKSLLNPTSPQVRAVYDALYRETGIRHLDSFYLRLLRKLKIQREQMLLDVACGQGSMPIFASRKGALAFGVDFSLPALSKAWTKNPPFFTVADGEALPYASDRFDYVTSLGSLEHYLHPLTGAREMSRVLKPTGRALILLPNTFSLMHHVWTALRTGRTGSDQQPIQRCAALREWQDLLEEGGLKVLHVYKYEKEFPCSLHDTIWYWRHPKELLRLLLTPLIPLPWAFAFVYLCTKKESAGFTVPPAGIPS